MLRLTLSKIIIPYISSTIQLEMDYITQVRHLSNGEILEKISDIIGDVDTKEYKLSLEWEKFDALRDLVIILGDRIKDQNMIVELKTTTIKEMERTIKLQEKIIQLLENKSSS